MAYLNPHEGSSIAREDSSCINSQIFSRGAIASFAEHSKTKESSPSSLLSLSLSLSFSLSPFLFFASVSFIILYSWLRSSG
jgi:hypothetical protein